MQFLAAPLLFGLVLAGVPILIHLLNRRRFQLVEWAPMKYLKLTLRSNRRRMRIEQLLLLALRTLLMMLIILTVARPILAASGLGSWLTHRARTSRVIVLDDSLSMGYRQNGRTALDLGKDAAAEILHRTGAQDAVTVLTTSFSTDPLIRQASVQDPTRLLARIDALHPTDAACSWTTVFQTVDDCLTTATFPQKQLILITDLRRSSWRNGVTEFTNRWSSLGVEAKVIDVGSRETANVSLTNFVQEDPIALPGAAVRLSATIRNDTRSPINGAQGVLTVDGQTRPAILPDLPAGAVISLPLSVVLETPGQHSLQLSLPNDAMNGDNTRYLSVNVRQSLDLALIDGRLGAGPFESASDFLNVALTVGQEPWHVQRIGDGDPLAARPPAVDVTALTDVAAISFSMATEYEKRVRQGMGLIIFPGEQIDPQSYNDHLFAAGLLPMKLDRVLDGPVQGIVVEGFSDSPLSPLAKIAPAALAKISTRRLIAVETPATLPEGVRVLARWNDPEGHPAIIEKKLGKGRVIFWTTTADREWTDWPVDPTYVLAVRSALLAIARPDGGDDNLIAGQVLEYHAGIDHPMVSPSMIPPEDPTPQPLQVNGSTLRYPHTQHAGIYTLKWKDAGGAEQTHRISVSHDKTASDLEPLTDSQLLKLIGNLQPEIVHYHAGQLAASASGREIWRTLAASLLGLLFLETLMAFWVGRER